MIERVNTASLLKEIDKLCCPAHTSNVNDVCMTYSQKNDISKEKVYEMITYLSEKGFIIKLPDDNADLKLSAEGRDLLDQDKITNIDFIHKEIDRKVTIQLDSIDAINNKLNLNLVFVSGFLGLMLDSAWFTNFPKCVIVIVLCGFSIAITLILIGMFVRSYAVDPSPNGLITNYSDSTYINTLYSVAKSKAEAHDKNKKSIQSKKNFINCSYKFLFISIVVLFLFYALSI